MDTIKQAHNFKRDSHILIFTVGYAVSFGMALYFGIVIGFVSGLVLALVTGEVRNAIARQRFN